MAILWIDGFDHYTATNNTVFDGVSGAAYVSGTDPKLVTSTLTSGMAINANNRFSAGVSWILPSAMNSGTIGFGAHVSINTANSDDRGAGLYAGSTKEIWWYVDGATNSLFLACTGQTTKDCSTALVDNTLYHIELKAVLAAGTGGSVELRVNGQTVGSFTGINTGSLGIDRVVLGINQAGASGWDILFDDLFIWDGTGTVNNDFIGERNVETLFPNADTATAAWTLSTGTSGFDLINDVPPADATNYLSSSTIGDESQFELESLTNTGITVTAVQVIGRADKADSGAASLQVGIIESGGTADYSAGDPVTQDQFLYFHHVSEVNPATLAEWTASDITSAKVGIKRA